MIKAAILMCRFQLKLNNKINFTVLNLLGKQPQLASLAGDLFLMSVSAVNKKRCRRTSDSGYLVIIGHIFPAFHHI